MQPIAGGRPFIFARAIAGAGAYSDAGALVATTDSVLFDLNQTDQQGAQVDASFASCKSATPDAVTDTAQWQAFYAGYKTFSASARAMLGSTFANLSHLPTYLYELQALDDSIQSYAQQMNHWADVSVQVCGGSASQNKPAPKPKDKNEIQSTLDSATILVGVALVAYLAITYLPRPRRP